MTHTEIIGYIITALVPTVGVIFGYGRLNAKVDDMTRAQSETSQRRDRELSEIRSSIIVLDAKLDSKKLDKEVFAQFAAQVEKNAERNSVEHDGINTKLDQIKDLISGGRA